MKCTSVDQLKGFRSFLKPTRAENFLKKAIEIHIPENYGMFKQQYIVGFYILDFFNKKRNVAIEVDGSIHCTEKQMAHDRKKDQFLNRHGIKVIRFTNDDVMNNAHKCATMIKSVLDKMPKHSVGRKGFRSANKESKSAYNAYRK